MALTTTAVAMPLITALVLSRWVVRSLHRNPSRRLEVARGYSRIRRILQFINLGCVVLAIVGLGWGWTVHRMFSIQRDGTLDLAPFAELAVPLPYFLLVIGNWIIYFDAERALYRVALGSNERPFWTRTGYVLHQLRQLLLLIGLPIGLFVGQQSLTRMAPELARTDGFRFGSLAAVPLLVLFMPLVIRPLLGLQSLPDGPVRARLESLAKRLDFRCSDLLIWPTRGAAANAMIVGLLPRVRYVIFTDRLLDEMPPDELDAVFGHEVGHARHGHIWYYVAFLALSMAVLAASFLLIAQSLDKSGFDVPEPYVGWLTVPPLVVSGAYIFLVFGFLSRRCERQADVFGCRAVSCTDPNCTTHDDTTIYPPRGRSLCPTGIRTFARGLERVYLINGHDVPEPIPARRTIGTVIRGFLGWLRDWMHSTMTRRVEFLATLIREPARERRFQRRVRLLRWGLIAGLLAALVAMGEAVGWRELVRAL